MPTMTLASRRPTNRRHTVATSAAPTVLNWPLPALLAWGLAWAAFVLLQRAGLPLGASMAVATGLGMLPAAVATKLSRMRRSLVALGFPLSLLASGAAAGLPGWAWLLPLALLLLAYPLGTWRDAPLFPTPARALDGLDTLAPLAPGALVLDAGCGLGHGLAALRRAYPEARLSGVEWSRPLALLARLRCRRAPLNAAVLRGDMWAADWRGQDLVYLFQRPESLPRAVLKARDELAPGAWLASLEFEARELAPHAVLHAADGRPVWLYQAPFITVRAAARRSAGSSARRARR